jgi:hypothetical protein
MHAVTDVFVHFFSFFLSAHPLDRYYIFVQNVKGEIEHHIILHKSLGEFWVEKNILRHPLTEQRGDNFPRCENAVEG